MRRGIEGALAEVELTSPRYLIGLRDARGYGPPMLSDIFANPWAYLPPRSTLWLWIGGPLLVLIVWFLTTRTSKERKRRLREADIWRKNVAPERPASVSESDQQGAPYRPDPAKKKETKGAKKERGEGPPRVTSIPAALHGAVLTVGGGEVFAHYQLVRDLAYLTLVESNATAGSDYQTVSAKLEEGGPFMSIKPLQRIDGVPIPNTGVQFKKDPELMNLFLIEGPDAKAIGRWLSAPLRRALCENPNAWLRVEGKTMTVSVFGGLEADQLDRLVELADTFFAEHGADGGPSLFGEEPPLEPVIAKPQKASKGDKPKKKPAVPSTAETHSETPISKRRG